MLADDGGRGSCARRAGGALALAALCSLAAAAPGLTGSWVYDDRGMLDNPLYDEPSDLLSVFSSDSSDYIGHGESDPEATRTYRPATMLTLVGTHVVMPEPWAHHAVGWAIHFLVVLLFYLALARTDADGRLDWVAAWMAALLLLHPVGVEAYVWINGRSDLVAGFFLSLLVCLRPGRRPVSLSTALAWLLIGFAGTASKLPFAIAALALWTGAWFRQDRGRRHFKELWLAVSLCLGIALFLLAAFRYGELGSNISAGASRLGLGWLSALKLWANAVHALFSLRVAAMQSLAWNAIQAWSPADILGAVMCLLATGALLWRRDWGGLSYLTGAALSFAPALYVTKSIWFGFDRYLYMPLILVLLALEPYARALVARMQGRLGLVRFVAATLLLVAALNTNLASRTYANHRTFLEAMVMEREDDPTLRLYIAGNLHGTGQTDKAAEVLAAMPDPPWPRAMIVPQARLARAMGDGATLDRTIAYARRAYPNDPGIRVESMHWDYRHGRIEQALALAAGFADDDPQCDSVRQDVRRWSDAATGELRARMLEAAEGLQCKAP